MTCPFVTVLQKLQKHSAESVESAHSSSEYSRYLHVDRPIQDAVAELLDKESKAPRKSLVLLCGSAGDGKSHMLAFFKTEYPALLDCFDRIINDATESDAPSRTACQTLASQLRAFDDDHIDDPGTEKVIVAINEGMLQRFITSESGLSFRALRAFVENAEVLKTGIASEEYDSTSVFHSTSFSNYHPFTLAEGRAKTDFIDSLLSKVFSPVEDNPFYRARVDCCEQCSSRMACPVCHNYDFMMMPAVQKEVAKTVVGVVLAEHYVVTARALLNLVYDLIVAPAFDSGALYALGNGNLALEQYIPQTTPSLMYSYRSGDSLTSRVTHFDVLLSAPEGVDDLSIRLRASSGFVLDLIDSVKGTPYHDYLFGLVNPQALFNSNGDADHKRTLLHFFVRCASLAGCGDVICSGLEPVPYLDDYVELLYAYNTDDHPKMKKVFKCVQKAIEDWNGDYPPGFSRVASYGNVHILQKIETGFNQTRVGFTKGEELPMFSPSIVVRAYLKDKDSPSVDFVVDYSLYCLLRKMEKGYQPTLLEKKEASDFATSYERLIGQGSKSHEVFVARQDVGKKPLFRISFDSEWVEYSVEVLG